MTNIRKSDAQLDAEASAPLEERDLTQAIALHRAAYAADLYILRLHVRGSGTGTSTALGKDEDKDDPDPVGSPVGQPIGWTGMAFNPAFANFLNGEYGRFPWSNAMAYLRTNVCRGTHLGHAERDEWQGALCHTLVSLVIRAEYSLDMARFELGLSDEAKTRRLLDNALLSIERSLDELLRREQAKQAPEPRKPSEWMGSAWVHRRLDGLHLEECEQCAR